MLVYQFMRSETAAKPVKPRVIELPASYLTSTNSSVFAEEGSSRMKQFPPNLNKPKF